MDREFRRHGRDPRTLSGLEMGALTCHAPADAERGDALAGDLAMRAREVERVLVGDAEDVLPAPRVAGGSPGGARPEVVVACGTTGGW